MSAGASVHDARSILESASRAALGAVDAVVATRRALDRLQRDGAFDAASRLVVLALGKAAPGMANAVLERSWSIPLTGIVITKDRHAEGFDLAPLELHETSHPVPDARSAQAGRRALDIAAACEPESHLLVLLSGGASALASLPPDEIEFEDLARLNDALLGSGAPIEELNAVRKHLSLISGGRIARASRAGAIRLLVISDVPGDDLAVIGSGPCTADPSTFADAREILRRRLRPGAVPAAIARYLERGASGGHPESVKPGDQALARVTSQIVARNAHARRAAAETAIALGARGVDLGERLSGEASGLGRAISALVGAARSDRATLLVAGGETVVTLREEGHGLGGRNQELALACAFGFEGARACILAVGTDGTDGPTDAAGAFADGSTLERARARGLDPMQHLARNDAYPFFDRLGDLHRTGPTGTNVMDLLLIWVPADPRMQSP